MHVGRCGVTALEPNLRNPPNQAIHVPSDIGVDAQEMTRALVTAAVALGATTLYETEIRSLQMSGERVDRVLSASGFHSAATVVLTAGTNVPKLCEPLPVLLPVAASAGTLVRIAAPTGLVKTIVATPEFEIREACEGELLMALPDVGHRLPKAEQAVFHAFSRFQDAFRGGDRCRVLGYRTAERPVPEYGPLIGYASHDRSVYVAVMHSGVTLAPTVGRLIADELVTGRPAPELRRCRPPLKH